MSLPIVSPPRMSLPIEDVLPAVLAALETGRCAVLEAPPGAGKTTRTPLALLNAPWRVASDGRILMLEPRRVAARAAAARLAESLGEKVGETVGYRIRHERRVSAATRIEVITEGVLTRRLQSDPALDGVAAVLFDEFHERSIHADLGLALCLEAQGALREDLRLLAMSATLDGAAVAELMGDAPRIRSEGRAHPVETRYLDAPVGPARGQRGRGESGVLERATADLIERALAETKGDVLAFLPGAAEIERTAGLLRTRQDVASDRDIATDNADAIAIAPLYAALPFAAQQLALKPDPEGRRKVVLSSALAETSLTIEGVRVVVDAGRSRRARFDPGVGMSRLVTTRVSKAAAEQRRGRAGRTAPGVCYRLWTRAEEGGFPERDPPEILEADLASFALDLAAWGAGPEALALLDPPPPAALAQARALLTMLEALDANGRVTAHGQRLAALPLHPRLAHLALRAKGETRALRLVALLDEGDPLRGRGADLRDRLTALDRPAAAPQAAQGALHRVAEAARRLGPVIKAAQASGTPPPLSLGACVALAYPDRIAIRRQDSGVGGRRYQLSNGKGAQLTEGDALIGEALLAVAELGAGADRRPGADAVIRLAAPLDRGAIDALFGDALQWRPSCAWSKRDRAALARERLYLFDAILEERPWADPPPEAWMAAMLEGVRQLGLDALPWTPGARRLQARVARCRAQSEDAAPDLSNAALLSDLESWLGPHLTGMKRERDLAALPLERILEERLDWAARQRLDEIAPAAYRAPTGTRAPVDYGDAAADPPPPPRIAIKLPELYGVTAHPTVAGEPLLIDLLSPAGRPIQTTADLPGFWRGSYADVAKEMRARYPRHPWPEDPAAAPPTTRAKRRKD